MSIKNKPIARRQVFLGALGVLAMMLACSVIGGGSGPVASTSGSFDIQFQAEDGLVEAQDENGDWTPVAGDSFFDVTAELERIDPWSVAGIAFETNELTRIEENLQAGDLVRVQGLILEDGTWLANSIQRAEEQIDPIIILIGKVDSVDPWVVNGIQLNVTADTEVQGTITPGTFVRVEILLLPDGTWEALSIIPFGDPDEGAGCVTVVATVLSVEGDEIQLSGWPAITSGENVEIDAELEALSADQTVLLVVCPTEDGQIVLVQIVILNNGDDEGDEGTTSKGEKVLVCHKPDKKGGHTISIASAAVPAHLAHGDILGPCP